MSDPAPASAPGEPDVHVPAAAGGVWERLPRRLRKWCARLPVLLILPLVLLGPVLVRGRLFLPQAPAMFEPLASEQPEAAAAARGSAHGWTGDRLMPVLLDQMEVAERVRAGEGLGWQPDLSLGLPLLGNAIHGPFYPPNWLALVVPPEQAAVWLALLALTLAGLGTWRFLERRGLPTAAAAIGALGLQAAGFGALNLHYGMKVDAVLWLPFCLTAIEDVARGRRWAGVAVLLTAALPFTTGFPPIALFALAVSVAYALVFLGPLRRLFGIEREPAPRALPRVLALLALAPLVAAPALLPTLRAAGESMRGDKDAEAVAAESLPAVHALGLLAPHLWGRPDDLTPGNRQPAVWWFTPPDQWPKAETASPLEWDPWTGSALLVLAVVGLVCGGARARFPALLVLLAFGFAQGWPIVRLAYHLPGFGTGAPVRALSVAWFGWAWLGALGATSLLERRPGARRIACGVALAIGVLAMVLWQWIEPTTFGAGMEKRLAERYGKAVAEVRAVIPQDVAVRGALELGRRLSLSGQLMGVTFVALLLGSLGGAGTRRRLPMAMCAAFCIDALAVSRDHTRGLVVPEGAELFPRSQALDHVREAAAGSRVWRIDTTAPALAETLQLARPNLLSAYGARDVSAYVAFTPRRTVELFEGLEPRTRVRSGVGSLPDLARIDHPLLDRADVGAILAVEPLEHERLELVHARPGFAVHRRTGALGLAHFARTAEVVADPVARVARLIDPATDPHEVVLLEAEPETVLGTITPVRGASAMVELVTTRPAPDRIAIDARGGHGGWLVVHEAWSAGWRATLDGEPLEVVPADHAFMAVLLRPGGGEVVFEFDSGARLGLLVGAVALAVGLALSRGRRPLV